MAKTTVSKPKKLRTAPKGHGILPGGSADVRPSAGYAGNEPVRLPDETDAQFQGRVSSFENAKRTAEVLDQGGSAAVGRKKFNTSGQEVDKLGFPVKKGKTASKPSSSSTKKAGK